MVQVPGSRAPKPLHSTFVGRERELAELVGGLEDSLAGRGRLFMVVGEPGIGKTRVAEEVARHARESDARILWGRCHEGDGIPAYWPWIEIIRSYAGERDPNLLVRELGPGAADIAQVVTELRLQVPGLPPPQPLDSEQARFRLFDSIGLFFRRAASQTPLLLILDALHWADRPSLLLLQFLARELQDSAVLLVGTYRHTELGRQHPLSQTLGELTLSGRIVLRGLPEADVGRLIERAIGHEVPQSLVSAVYRETEGNPFFVSEVVRLLAQEGRLEAPSEPTPAALAIPQGIREVIGKRLDRLSAECNRALSMAAVIGREFRLDVLERVSARRLDLLLGLMEEALEAGVIAESPLAIGRYAFSQALIRDTLYREIPHTRRVALHRKVADALEELHGQNPEPHLTELAHHFHQAVPTGAVESAIRYSLRAGAQAARSLAHEEAAAHYDRALQVLQLAEPVDDRRRCEVLLALAEAHARSGDVERARESFRRVADVAKSIAQPGLLAEAALGFGLDLGGELEGISTVGHVDDELISMLRDALDTLSEDDSALRAKLLGRLAAAYYWSESRERRAELSHQALEMAKRAGDAKALVAVLNCSRYALLGPENVQERLAASTEMLRLAREVDDNERELEAHRWRLLDFLELGNIAAADREIEEHTRLATELRHPFSLWLTAVWKAMRAFMEGRYPYGQQLAQEALSAGERTRNPHAMSFFGAQMFRAWWEQGKLENLETAVTGILQSAPSLPAVRCALAFAYSELDRKEEARAQLELLSVNGFQDLPRDVAWLISLSFLAQVASSLGDRERAALLYDLLLPYAWCNVVVGPPPAACYGPVAHYLGLLAMTLRRSREAEGHFEEALKMSAAMGARPWMALTHLEYARLLSGDHEKADPERGRKHLSAAVEIATDLGMQSIVEKASALRGGAVSAAVVETPSAAKSGRRRTRKTPAVPSDQQNVIRREGDYWTIVYEGRSIRLRDAKGLHYLGCLLLNPGRDFHVADLVTMVQGTEESSRVETRKTDGSPRGRNLGHAGELLDGEARSQYKKRLDDLRTELEEATRLGDGEQASRLQRQIDFIAQELAAAYGLGGRSRKAADVVERIRKAVTNRIRDRISRIRKEHPSLGAHLGNAVRMGAFCSYSPERPVSWSA